MFSEVNPEKATFVKNGIRNLFAALDKAVYGLLGIAYQIFFNVASADIFSSGTITQFAQRIQLIIGVFVMFQLVMTIIRGIINPDTFTDSKSGAGNIVFRIATALVMLTLVVPINLNTVNNEYERKVSNSGLLFGTLYSLQYRILKNNTIGKLVMGETEQGGNNYVVDNDDKDLARMSNRFVTSILRGFYRINLAENYKEVDGKEPAMIASNRMCDIYDEDLQKYLSDDATISDIVDSVDIKCTKGLEKRYAFNYMPLVSLIIGILFTLIMLSFCVDVATRTIKLGMLQLIAPLPIISYMDPKGGKDGAFSAWIKLVISTYIDLFIRIASIYFAIFVIQEMLENGISMVRGGIIGIFTRMAIYVGLFYFAKEAPKFIKQALGIKDDGGGGLFSGFGKAMAVGSVGIGAIGAGISKGIAANERKGGNIGKALLSGISGTVSGGWRSGKEFMTTKDPNSRNIMKNNRAYNDRLREQMFDKSTLGGRIKAGLQSDFGVPTELKRMDEKNAAYASTKPAWSRIDGTLNSLKKVKDANDRLERMKLSGQYSEGQIEAQEKAVKALKEQEFNRIVQTKDPKQLADAQERLIFNEANNIYSVGDAYKNDPDEVFKEFQNVQSVHDMTINTIKKTVYTADTQVEATKAGPDYARAKADAQRVEESKK